MPKVVPEYKEEAKRRIIEAAMEVIAERGCDQLTFEHVAQKIGVTKGAVYWYFKTKDELITAVLKKFQSEFERVNFDLFYNRPIEEMFLQIFEKFSLNDYRQRAIFFEMFAIAVRNLDLRRSTRDYYSSLVTTFEDAVKKEQKQNPKENQMESHKLALLMVALYSGLQNLELVWLCQDEIKDLWLDGIQLLLNKKGNDGLEKK
ncbi:TetR/AcrR family transcriptional regulator [Methanospirillum hungatei]|uniref:TetR/AcrR family transcriptional regulator n=1 Tax=Methanospirillum hungatei TaxID=2203 RepID=UPI0026EC6DFF|nr:TetR/AcrR family transcriptional regulator [Methanospirillum hungatei]MCA1917688.1 TetR/AcrR family transcriptional regulator [Methanospirillum hungatei]